MLQGIAFILFLIAGTPFLLAGAALGRAISDWRQRRRRGPVVVPRKGKGRESGAPAGI